MYVQPTLTRSHTLAPAIEHSLGAIARAYFFTTFPTEDCVPLNAKDSFTARFPQLNTAYFDSMTRELLSRLYPKYCPECNEKLTVEIHGRENAIRCPKCHFQGSRTSYTPLHHFKLPLWVFGYILCEAINMYPQVLSGAGIKRRLGVSNNTASLLKRRLQLFLSDLMPHIKRVMAEDIRAAFENDLPDDPEEDMTPHVAGKPVVNMDTVALFSASQRANGGRKRHKHTGQTASIYLTDQVAQEKGKYQIGTLVHTIAIKQGAIVLDSVPDQTQRSLHPLMDFLPEHAHRTTVFPGRRRSSPAYMIHSKHGGSGST